MSALPDPNPNPNPNPHSDWTIVSYRRNRNGRNRAGRTSNPFFSMEALTLDPVPPSPWTPTDPSTSRELEAEVLSKIQFTMHRLETSRFYARVLDRLQSPKVQSGVSHALSSASELPMVIYGIGNIATSEISRIQLAFALLLRDKLPITSMEIFDPVLSGSECAVLKSLGLSVLAENEKGRRVVSAPTLFFLPHCDAALYDNLLSANWEPARLNRIVLLGNSFAEYAFYLSWVEEKYKSDKPKIVAPYAMAVRQYVREVALEERQDDLKRKGDSDEDSALVGALWSTSWHFFDLEDGTVLNVQHSQIRS
ncbi:Cyclin-like protein [Dioscorea alata]|uniref:Cyclin-like protein n=1 Tax=Dioscorea alata TaxID=55571 RepID=A0ACB7VU16_DIOAL|nr:Cyclin-like protein [Dioscorea alata]